MWSVSGLVLLLVVAVALLPASVAANSGPDVGSAGAGAGRGRWAGRRGLLRPRWWPLSGRSRSLCSHSSLASPTLVSRAEITLGQRGARDIANTVGNGVQWWAGMGNLSWDYVTHYLFQQSATRGLGVAQALGQLTSLSGLVNEVTRLGSDGERLQWLARNYARAFTVAKSALSNLLTVFDSDGAIRNCLLAIQREVLQGDLLRDVLRLGPNDLEGVVRMVKEVLQRVFAPAPQGPRVEEL